MSKFVLEIEQEVDFILFGIACHRADYRLGWEINRALELDLEKQDDYPAEEEDENSDHYSMYYYNDEENYREFYLIANKTDNSFLIPEQRQVDYFLQVYGFMPDEDIHRTVKKLNSISMVLTAFKVDTDKMKSIHLLIR